MTLEGNVNVLDDIRFWIQVIQDSKRTIICHPDLESRCKTHVNVRGLARLITVITSSACPPDRVYILDEQAINAGAGRRRPNIS